MTRTSKLLTIVVTFGQIAFFTFIALHRFIDADEGSYLLASRLVLLGKKPYTDFFYNQAPLLPYVYAAWLKCTHVSWTSAKVFSAVLTSLLGTLLYRDVERRTQSWLAGLCGVILFASSTLIFAWFPVAKTYSLAGLLLFSSYAIFSSPSTLPSRRLIAAAGLLLGLSVDTRSYLLLVAPVFLWWIVKSSGAANRLASILWFVAGFAVGIVPLLVFFFSSPGAFFFDNLGYHAIRSSRGLIGWWWEKLVIVLQLFLGGGEGNGLQWSLLFLVIFGLILSFPERRCSPRLALQVGIVLAFICLLPTPAYLQYFCLCVPFLIVSATCMASNFFSSMDSSQGRRAAVTACLVLLTIYVGVSANDFRRYLVTGNGVPGVKAAPDKGDWRLSRVIEVSEAIDRIATPNEVVASFWPGDIFQTHTRPFPGFENPFGLPVAEKLTPEQTKKYRILSPAEVKEDFAAHTPRVVVLRNQIISPASAEDHGRIWDNGDTFRNSLLTDGYTQVQSIGGISIFVCCGQSR